MGFFCFGFQYIGISSCLFYLRFNFDFCASKIMHPTILITVGQWPTALAVGAGGGCLDIFILIYPFSPLSPSLWETTRYRLKYCLKGPLNPKQPTNQPKATLLFWFFGDFRCGALLFMVILVIYKYENR